MAHFEELQELWQQQAETPISHFDAASLANDFRRYGRRQDLINYAKSVLVAVQFVYLLVRLWHRPVELFGAVLVDCCCVYFLIHEWRNQRAVARLDFAARSVDFVRVAIARLQALRNPFRGRPFYILMIGFWVGSNVMLGTRNWTGHVVLTLLPFIIYYPSVYLRGKRWDHDCRPLVERLTALIESAEERTP